MITKKTKKRLISFLTNVFDDMQIAEICEGIRLQLTFEQIKIYADPKFAWSQMGEIRSGFQNGLTIEQINMFANENFTWEQMYYIRLELEKIKN